MILRFLFGEDVFISYSRRDGASYAATLANELSKPGSELSCFLDQWGASAANELSGPVRRALRRSRVLVLVGTPGASASVLVREEVQRFSKPFLWTRHRPILPINVDGGLDQVTWTELTGLHRIPATRETEHDGVVSPSIVRVIRDSYTFTTRNQRVRRLSLASALFLALSAGTGVYALNRARAARVQEQAAIKNAEDAKKAQQDAEASLKRANTLEVESTANKRLADEERLRAERQAHLAEARQLSASAALMVQEGNRLPEGVQNAIRAIQSEEDMPVVEGYQALRNGLAVLPRMVAEMPHTQGVRFASLSRDGGVLATADADRVNVWDTRRSRLIASRSYGRGVLGLALSPNAELLVVGYGGLMDVLRVPPVGRARAAPDTLMTTVARPVIRQPARPTFSPDGRFFAASGYGGGTTRVWNVADWKELGDVPGGDRAIAFSADGTRLFVAGQNAIRSVANSRDKAEVKTLETPSAIAVAFSADGTYAAAADATRVRAWRWVPASLEWMEVTTITQQTRVSALAIRADGRLVCIASADGTARVWDLVEQRDVLRLTHDEAITAVAFSEDGRFIVTAGEDEKARMWETTPDVSTYRFRHNGNVRAVAFGQAKDSVWTIADDGLVRQSDLSSSGAQRVLEDNPAMSDGEAPYTLLAAAFDPTGQHGAVAVSDGTIYLWNLATGAPSEWTVDEDATALAVGPRGDVVAVGGNGLEVFAIEDTPRRRFAVGMPNVRALSFSLDGRYLAAAAAGQLQVIDVARGKAVRVLRTRADTRALVFSANGQQLVIADAGGGVSVWEWRSGDAQPVRILAEGSQLRAVAMSADGRHLAYATGGRVTAVWDLASRREVARLRQESEVNALAFSRDGRYLATANADRAARALLWRPADLIEEAQRRLSLPRPAAAP